MREVRVQMSQGFPNEYLCQISGLKEASKHAPSPVLQRSHGGLAEADRLPHQQTDTGSSSRRKVVLNRETGHRRMYAGRFGVGDLIFRLLDRKDLQADSQSLDADHFVQYESLRQPRSV